TGYQAGNLSGEQRILMAAILSCKPGKETATTINEIVTSVSRGKTFVSQTLFDQYQSEIDRIPKQVKLVYRRNTNCQKVDDLSPLDPFLNIAERVRLPVAVKKHHVEVSLSELAEYLDSPVSSMRLNLQNAILRLHAAGYFLRNHPGLTHGEARDISDDDSI
ncbi:MAG: endonuclease, partial [Gammaproteobacteria bacterium]|nr:endonuclease [Gammaproteobacteria bacterium]